VPLGERQAGEVPRVAHDVARAQEEPPLGALDGVALGITDVARAADGGWVFSAVAEDTGNAYDDGACVGSVLGQFDAAGRLVRKRRIEGGLKVEGVAFANATELWLATDADDPARPSALYSVGWD
jgi:hypothetical protein